MDIYSEDFQIMDDLQREFDASVRAYGSSVIEIERLREEVSRLRTALESISGMYIEPKAYKIAIAALKARKEKE